MSTPAFDAVQPDRAISLFEFQHSVVQPGGETLGPATSLTQDKDGFLWLTILGGELARFDGQQVIYPYARQLHDFEPATTILFGPDGSSHDMWIGHRRGGITHLVDGVATHYDGGEVPRGTVFGLLRDRSGVLWALSPSGVARFIHGQWHRLPADMGWINPRPEAVTVDAATGDIYVRDTDQGALVSRAGSHPFESVPASEFSRVDAGLPKTAVWSLKPEQDGPAHLAADQSLWFGGVGLDRFRWSSGKPVGPPDIREHMGLGQGLSGVQAWSIVEDREGDIWVSTAKGLDRFRRPHFTPLVTADPVELPTLLPMPDGSMWVASMNQAPFLLKGEQATSVPALKPGVSAMLLRRDGSVLFAGIDGIRRWKDGKVEFLPVPPRLAHAGTRFHKLVEDPDGSIWISAMMLGLYHVTGSTWVRVNGQMGLPEETPTLLTILPDGTIRLAYSPSRIFELKQGHARELQGSRDLAIGAPLSWLADGKAIWMGGTSGLARWQDGHVFPVHLAGVDDITNVTGIVRDRDGSLWISYRGGAQRVSPEELKRFDQDPSHPLAGQHFHASEGAGASNGGSLSMRSLTLDPTGRVWSISSGEVSFIDPASASLNTVRPNVFIESVSIDQRTVQTGPHDVIPALTRSLSIDYTAPMLRRPGGARFQYQLSGVNSDWQEAGTRRSAYYTNLDPGKYTFRVRAFNEDGIMSANDAVYEFRVAAAWYQTWAFRIAMGLLLLALGWAGYVHRMRTVTSQLRIRTEERERIARDLHDTLLQGFQGLALRFYAVRNRVAPGELQTMIDSALARTDHVLAEGRDKIAFLRNSPLPSTATGGDLVREVTQLTDSASDVSTASFNLHVAGTPRLIRMAIFDEVLAIAREALCNAMTHSSAAHVDVELNFGRRSFVLTIRDDGIGFDPNRGEEGHWGLIGMRERARAIRADLSIESSVGAGARLELRLQARKAHPRRGAMS